MSQYDAHFGRMEQNDITLEQLSERTGIEARTLRSWISEGLLAPPLRSGRGATYPASNVERALAVRALKDLHGLSFSEIGRRFMMATEEQIRDWAGQNRRTSVPSGSARDYLSRIRDQSTKPERRAGPVPPSSEPFFEAGNVPQYAPSSASMSFRKPSVPTSDLASIERLILSLEGLLGAQAPRRSRGAVWTRVSVTPDLELSIRGDLAPHERVLFEQLADQLRALLIGGTKNE